MGPTVGAVSPETNLGILWVETPFHKGIDKRASPDVLKVPRQIRFLTVAGNKRVGRVDAPLREAFGHVPLHTDPGRPAQSGAGARPSAIHKRMHTLRASRSICWKNWIGRWEPISMYEHRNSPPPRRRC